MGMDMGMVMLTAYMPHERCFLSITGIVIGLKHGYKSGHE
jgi:hypothetical protein